MDHTTAQAHATLATSAGRSVPALFMAVVAPFAAIGLLATPLAFDALKHLAGI